MEVRKINNEQIAHERQLVSKSAEYRSPTMEKEWYDKHFAKNQGMFSDLQKLFAGLVSLLRDYWKLVILILIVVLALAAGMIVSESRFLLLNKKLATKEEQRKSELAKMPKEKVYSDGLDLFNQANFTEAKQNFEEIYNREPQDVSQLQYLALSEYNLKEYDKAEEHFNKIISINPKNYFVFNILGNLYRDTDKIKQAKDNYNKAISINHQFVTSYVNLISLLDRNGDREGAKLILADALKNNPDSQELNQISATMKK